MRNIELPCELGDTLYWVRKDSIWECEFWGIQYYYGTNDKEPSMYIKIPDIKQPLMCIDGNTGAVRFDGYWTDDMRQPKMSEIGKNIFRTLEEAKVVLNQRIEIKKAS